MAGENTAASVKVGGYLLQFVQPPPEPLVCKLCQLPARDPHLSQCCRYNFCASCLNSHTKNATKVITCPVCSDYHFITDRNKQARVETQSLQVFCPNRAKGCGWRGKIPEIKDHISSNDGCQFEPVMCQCKEKVLRGNLQEHYRNNCPLTPQMSTCQYCSLRKEKGFIQGAHVEQCLKAPLACPNNCEIDSVTREEMSNHLEECPLQLIPCEYQNVGCKVKVYRKDMSQHCEDYTTQHLHLVTASVVSTEGEVTDTKRQITDTTNQLVSAQGVVTDMLLQVASMVEMLAGNKNQKDKNLSIQHWQVWLCCRGMQSATKCLQAPIIIRITDFENKRRGKEMWYSEPFWSHHNGYKAQLKVYADGFAECAGTHFSMGICIQDGPNDQNLAWPVQGKFTMSLMNQCMDSNHHVDYVVFDKSTPHHIGGKTGPTDERVTAWGKRHFITQEDLRRITASRYYLKDDTVYIHISFSRERV
ncbi:TNF receptor-associated factor 3-like [Dysidea avara]|uniref:TNF receptor-associated factor 3-like n=1 Tax=Dysidea avara TaxID=196820 RepID=UPI0033256E2D